MNLSAQDHQTFFTCEADAGKPEYESEYIVWECPYMNLYRKYEDVFRNVMIKTLYQPWYIHKFLMKMSKPYHAWLCYTGFFTVMQTAWRERNTEVRIKSARSALDLNPECASAHILLAEEEATSIAQVSKGPV